MTKKRKSGRAEPTGQTKKDLLATAMQLSDLVDDCEASLTSLSGFPVADCIRELVGQLLSTLSGGPYTFPGLRSLKRSLPASRPPGAFTPEFAAAVEKLSAFLGAPPLLALRKALELLTKEKEAGESAVEQLRVQLAGCLVAAEGNLQNAVLPSAYGWSPAYQAVVDLRRRRDQLLDELTKLRIESAAAQSQYLQERADYERHRRVLEIVKAMVYPDLLTFKTEVHVQPPEELARKWESTDKGGQHDKATKAD